MTSFPLIRFIKKILVYLFSDVRGFLFKIFHDNNDGLDDNT